MSARLDVAFQLQRRRLAGLVQADAARRWLRDRHDREQAIESTLQVVLVGQARTVELVDAYMALKVGGSPKGLSPDDYTVEALRGQTAAVVYSRPFGAFAAHLAGGSEIGPALESAQSSLTKLVRTDLQLAQTHSARDWLADDPRVRGYRRVLGPGKNCSLCRSASTREYHREDLLPIHEGCHCTVAPITTGAPELSRPDDAVRVADDPELGPRLLDEAWAA